MQLRRFLTLFLLWSLFFTILGPTIRTAEAQAFKRVSEHDAAPDFTLKDVDGKEFKLSDFKGKVVGLVFWNNPSLRSASELAILQDLYLKHNADKGLEIIAVYVPRNDDSVSPDEIEEMKKILADKGITYLNLIDYGLRVFSQYGVITFPSYAVINETGKVEVILPGLPTFGGEKLIRRNTERLLGIEEVVKVVKKHYQPKGKAAFYYNFARQMHIKGFDGKALGKLERVLQEDPDYYKPYQLKAIILAKKDQLEEAFALYQKAVELAPDNVRLKVGLGEFYLDHKKRDEALGVYQELLEENPDSADGHYGLGVIFARQDKVEEALQELVLAKDLFQKRDKSGKVRFNPNRGHVHHQLGLLYTQKNDLEQAFLEFSQACEQYDLMVRKFSQ